VTASRADIPRDAWRFGGYIEPDEPGYDALADARDLVLEKLCRARNPRARLALVGEAEVCGLVVEPDPTDDFGGEAA
jgi:hypothetical protein